MSLPTKAKMSAAAAAALLTASFTANAASEGAGAPNVFPQDLVVHYSPKINEYDAAGVDDIKETLGFLKGDTAHFSDARAELFPEGSHPGVLLSIVYGDCEIKTFAHEYGDTPEDAMDFINIDASEYVYAHIRASIRGEEVDCQLSNSGLIASL